MPDSREQLLPARTEAFTHVIALDPDDTAMYDNRGAAYAALGEYNLVIADYATLF